MANWTIEERRQIWNKGQVVPGSDPAIWRKWPMWGVYQVGQVWG